MKKGTTAMVDGLLMAGGMTQREVAEAAGVSQASVCARARELGIDTRAAGAQLPARDLPPDPGDERGRLEWLASVLMDSARTATPAQMPGIARECRELLAELRKMDEREASRCLWAEEQREDERGASRAARR